MASTTAWRSGSSPTAEIITVAMRRSGAILTRETDASRTRGSFISVTMSDESSWRSCSAMRSGRGGRDDAPSTGWNRPGPAARG